jgi:3-hydroxyisobutyrate dehydrogenase-like beta-hydroxyacid dehydrogenase
MSERKPSIGYIGLGLMGTNMPLRLLNAGYQVTVWNRTSTKMAPVLEKGAAAGESAADVTRRSDIVQMCVLDTQAVEAVVFGPQGVIESAASGKVLVDHSTISAEATRAMAARLRRETGMGWVDCPVSGGTMGAESGTLVMMAGGDTADVERVRPVVAHLSRRFVHMGPQGAGQATKMVNQIAVSCIYVVLAEMVTLARKCGVEAEQLPAALEGGFADSRLLQVMGPRMIKGDFRPVGQVRTMIKDLELLGDLASATGTPLPLTALATQLFRLHNGRGHGELDITSVIKLYESAHG